MDCSTAQGNMGCDGGLMDDAFQYIILNKGIELESDYPYTAEDGNSCKYKVADRGACIQKYQDVPSGNETALQGKKPPKRRFAQQCGLTSVFVSLVLAVSVATVGPVSVAIDASQSSFQFYESGVYCKFREYMFSLSKSCFTMYVFEFQTRTSARRRSSITACWRSAMARTTTACSVLRTTGW